VGAPALVGVFDQRLGCGIEFQSRCVRCGTIRPAQLNGAAGKHDRRAAVLTPPLAEFAADYDGLAVALSGVPEASLDRLAIDLADRHNARALEPDLLRLTHHEDSARRRGSPPRGDAGDPRQTNQALQHALASIVRRGRGGGRRHRSSTGSGPVGLGGARLG
jgi:hypothetical protein